MFESLQSRLGGVFDKLRGRGALSESDVDAALAEVRAALIEADVALPVVKDFIDKVRPRAIGENVIRSVSPAQQVIKIVHDVLVEVLGAENASLSLGSPPAPILMVGLQGSGKTTNSAKLARWFKSQGRHPLLVGADLQRPAAVEQLRTLGRQIEVPVFSEDTDPVAVAAAGIAEARRTGRDVVIVDTAGRLAIDAELMDEVRRISAAVNPNYTFLVIDAMTGQDAVATAESFHQTLELDGVILTKLDGDARGGAALSVKEVVGRPIAFASTGEKLDEFDLFHPDRLAGRILGMGDMLTLIEKAEQVFEKEETEAAAARLLEGQFTFEDFLDQMQQLKKMGPLSGVLGMMPGVPKEVRDAQIDDREIARVEAIIRSMTPAERRDPDLIDQSRRLRIAKGSGADPTRVAELIKQFKEMSKMMKRMGGMGTKKLAKSRRKAGRTKGKGPGGRTTGGGRVAPATKAPLRLPNLDPNAPGKGSGLPDLGLPGLGDGGLGGGFGGGSRRG